LATLGAILDACVIFPASLRDTLLDAAAAGLFRVHWSDEILEELRRNLVIRRSIAHDKAQRLIDALQAAFPEARVIGYQSLIPVMTNDPKDRHVVAAALGAGAQVIVTSNLRDFPQSALAPFDIEALSPDAFLMNLFVPEPRLMTKLVKAQAARLRNPPMSVEQVLDALSRHAPGFVGLVREELARG
jgi:predicted nucleic acid-binding protein